MRTFIPSVLILALLAGTISAQEGGENTFLDSVDWVNGPGSGDLGGIARIAVPEGYIFAGPADTERLMAAMENLVSNTEKGFLSPADLFDEEGATWFLVFEFDDLGYVEKADEEEIDADELLESLKESNQEEIKERKRRGLPSFTLRGWAIPPRYASESKNLEWAVELVSEDGEVFVNHNIRVLGRRGVMVVTLVCSPEQLQEVLVPTRGLLEEFSFNSGQKYSEYTAGDKIWKYGLTGLIAGGGLALAAKAGILKWLWKILIPIGVAIAAFFRRIFGGRKKNIYAADESQDPVE